MASEGLATNIRQLPFVDLTKFTKDPTIVHRFAHIICSWILGRKDVVLDDDEKQWVEFGFAQFRGLNDSSSKRALIDEPLIILAAAQHLTTDTTVGLVNHVLNGLGSTGGAGRGTKLEELVAVYLVEALAQVCVYAMSLTSVRISLFGRSRRVWNWWHCPPTGIIT